MDVDVDIARWILEFVLRQPLDEAVLNAFIEVLPIPDDDSSWDLKKGLLLRRIESEISNGCVSEKILRFFEQIEQLDFQRGGIEAVSGAKAEAAALKAAYCEVAVECCMKFLRSDNSSSYFEAVKRIWRVRVRGMENADSEIGLLSGELLKWRDEIEAAVWEQSACNNALKKSKGNDYAVDSVRTYLEEAKESAGPSFLELVAETLTGDELLGIMEGEIRSSLSPAAPTAAAADDMDQSKQEHGLGSNGSEIPRHKHVAIRRSRGSKISEADDIGVSESCKNYGLLPSPEVDKVQKALASSSSELHAFVTDPLPDALHLAQKVVSDTAKRDMDDELLEESGEKVKPSIVDDAVQSIGEKSHYQPQDNDNASKPSLMERNSTACRFEWDDSISGSHEASSTGVRVQLPSPKSQAISPLKKFEMKNLMARRKKKRWSVQEEDMLRAGVQRYGVGKWKLILNAYREEFEDRTEVDLKDKWRNLNR